MKDVLTFTVGFGIFSSSLGLLMIVFNRPFASWFCKIGQSVWKDSTFKGFLPIDEIYDENLASGKMKILGWVFLAQGILVLFAALLIRVWS